MWILDKNERTCLRAGKMVQWSLCAHEDQSFHSKQPTTDVPGRRDSLPITPAFRRQMQGTLRASWIDKPAE